MAEPCTTWAVTRCGWPGCWSIGNPTAAHGSATVDRVDLDMAAVVDFDGAGRLLLSAGMARPASTFTRVVGTAGELRVSNPFHPRPVDSVELWVAG